MQTERKTTNIFERKEISKWNRQTWAITNDMTSVWKFIFNNFTPTFDRDGDEWIDVECFYFNNGIQ